MKNLIALSLVTLTSSLLLHSTALADEKNDIILKRQPGTSRTLDRPEELNLVNAVIQGAEKLNALMKKQTLAEVRISPDGKSFVFEVRTYGFLDGMGSDPHGLLIFQHPTAEWKYFATKELTDAQLKERASWKTADYDLKSLVKGLLWYAMVLPDEARRMVGVTEPAKVVINIAPLRADAKADREVEEASPTIRFEVVSRFTERKYPDPWIKFGGNWTTYQDAPSFIKWDYLETAPDLRGR